jgi:hypothetical protein
MHGKSRSPPRMRFSEAISSKIQSMTQHGVESSEKPKMRAAGIGASTAQTQGDSAHFSSVADVAGISMPSSAVVAALYKEREEKRKLMHQLRSVIAGVNSSFVQVSLFCFESGTSH